MRKRVGNGNKAAASLSYTDASACEIVLVRARIDLNKVYTAQKMCVLRISRGIELEGRKGERAREREREREERERGERWTHVQKERVNSAKSRGTEIARCDGGRTERAATL